MRVGIIGTGWGVSVQLPLFQQAGLEVVALYSRDLAKARQLCVDNDIDPTTGAYDDIAALLACKRVQLVSVVSPTFLHVVHALAALRAGKHVLCDKPLAVTAAEAAPLVAWEAEAATDCGKPRQIALVDHELRFLRCVQAARVWCGVGSGSGGVGDGGEGGEGGGDHPVIGALRHASASFLVNMRGLGMRAHSWWHERARGGGISAAMGVHVVDLLAFVTGRRFVSLSGAARTFITERPGGRADADDGFSIDGTLGGAGGALASVVVNGLATIPAERKLVLLGMDGAVVLDLVACTATRYDRKGREQEVVAEEDEEKGWSMAAPDAFVHGTFALAAALQVADDGDGDATSSAALRVGCTLEEGAYVVAVMDAMRASSDAGGARREIRPLLEAPGSGGTPSSRM